MEMGQRIKERRVAMNLTQEELATRLGLQKSAVAKYENGRVENIKRSVIQRMAYILDCSPCYLMGWEEPKEKETTLRPDESELLTSYNKLNDAGKVKAREAVDDLTENFKYALDPPALLAAHARTDVAPDPEGQAEDINILLQMAESHKSDANND